MCKNKDEKTIAEYLREGLEDSAGLQSFILSQPLWLLGTGAAQLLITAILVLSFPVGAVPLGSQFGIIVSILIYSVIMTIEYHRVDVERMAPRSWTTFTGPLIAMYGLFIYGLVSFALSYFH